MKWFVVTLFAFVSTMALAQAFPYGASGPPPDREIAIAQAAVGGMLKDPESARFSSEYYGKLGPAPIKSVTICGTVNAKNSYGGYTGKVPYVYFQKSKIVYILREEPVEVALIALKKQCFDE